MRRSTLALALILIYFGLAAWTAPTPVSTALPSPTTTVVPTEVSKSSPTSAPLSTPTDATPRGGLYKVALSIDAVTLHPFKQTDANSDRYIGLLYTRALWRYNPETLEPEPWAAESWVVSDENKTYTFKLREMQWSDGQPVTAYDWQWTFTQALKPENNWPYRAGPVRNISEYQALDDRTLRITLKEAKPLPVALSRINVLPAVLPKHIWDKYDWNDPTKNPEILRPSVVNGPYLLKEWLRDDHATFVRNDTFFKGTPQIEAITYRIISNASVAFQMLLTGEVDASNVSAGDFAQAKASDKLNLYQWDPAAASWDYVGMNLRRAPLSDVEFRHALAYATPRDAIIQNVYGDLSKPIFSAFPPASWVYNPNVPGYDYSLETAKLTLDKAGYRLDASGKRQSRDGTPITLRMLIPASVPASDKTAQILQEQFKQLGIDLEIRRLESSAFLQVIKTQPQDWDLHILSWGVGIEPSDIRDLWSEAGIPNFNRGGYVNKAQESLWDQAEREFDPAKRKILYQQIQQILSEDSPYIFLAYRTGWAWINKRVIPNPVTRVGIDYDLYKWTIKDSPN